MPGSGQFDIYQSPVGVTAVTNPVQRQILGALANGDLQLPELVELTGKAKSTLSSIHMKELLSRELVAELPHPTDSRRKIYRLVGALGASDARPVRSAPAVTPSTGISLAEVFRFLAAAPQGSEAALSAQAHAVGKRFASRLGVTDPSGFAHALTRFVEEERLAQHLQLDFEGMAFRCRPGPGVESVSPAIMGVLMAAFATGLAEGCGLQGVALRSEVVEGAFLLQPDRS